MCVTAAFSLRHRTPFMPGVRKRHVLSNSQSSAHLYLSGGDKTVTFRWIFWDILDCSNCVIDL